MRAVRRERDICRTRKGKVRLRSLDELDGRTASAVKARDLVRGIEGDLGADLSHATRQLAQRAGILAAILEDYECKWISGQQIEMTEYGSLCNVQRRILATLGLNRKLRDVTDASQSALSDSDFTKLIDIV